MTAMRTISEHQINECNRAIKLEASERESTGAPRLYVATIDPAKIGEAAYSATRLEFQHGPVSEGVNGITNELLLAILIDRLRGFQSGPFACEANNSALIHLMEARDALFERTKERLERGVEGTHAV